MFLSRNGFAALFTLLFLAGCTHKNVFNPNGGYDLNQAFKHDIEQADAASQGQWWTVYKDETLNALIETAFDTNPNLSQIRARLDQATAISVQNRAPLFPTVTLDGSRSRTTRGSGQALGFFVTGSEFALQGAASYELDIWGGNTASFNSSKASEAAAQEDIYTSKITLSASIVEAWLTILSLHAQENLIRSQIDTNKTILSLQERRFELGGATALDILQQEEQLALSQASLPDIVSAKEQALNNLIVLIGQDARSDLSFEDTDFPAPLPIPDAGLPSDLLVNRPDVRSAWLRLISADWAVNAAYADRLPSFNLSSVLSARQRSLDGIFEAWLLDLAASVSLPLIDGGLRRGAVQQALGFTEEQYHAYRETVLGAVIDVENALVANTYQDERLRAVESQLNTSRQTLERAQSSYANGSATYLNVLTSLNNVQALEQLLQQERLTQSLERVALYRALGGRAWAKDDEVKRDAE